MVNCKCGCGKEIKESFNRGTGKNVEYLVGHNNRGKHFNIGKKRSEQTRELMRKNNTHHKPWSLGLTKETDERIKNLGIKSGLSRKGSHVTEETKLKLRKYNTGKHPTKETRKKLSYNNARFWLGKKKSDRLRLRIKETCNTPEYIEYARLRRLNQVFPIKDTKIEIKIQEFLKELEITFFTHQYINIEHGYQCDIFIPSMNLVIECDGDYWHCNIEIFPNKKFTDRIIRQKELDTIRTKELQEKGYRVIRLWEHEIRNLDLNKFNEIILKR